MERSEVGALFLAGSHAFTVDELAELIGRLKEIYIELRAMQNAMRALGLNCEVFWVPVRGLRVRCSDFEEERRVRAVVKL